MVLEWQRRMAEVEKRQLWCSSDVIGSRSRTRPESLY